ncbi:DUF6624 domain-containing protein [Chryseobacterium sp.]|uniref:DUF6624 domain-containing protein n=1 Tax=Chryseobacterium sp. TaxID=1871047 RepID=UPI0025C23D86|nr:DUF6624 domain-containing protein [Chryseobacterium sp.]
MIIYTMNYLPFEKELIDLADKDLAVREKLLATGELYGGYHPEMEKIHKANAMRLREIIAEIGYPTISKVGEKANDAAWLIIQHAISEPEFMKACYAMMEENYPDISPVHKAYLYDRIQVFQSKPQRYGTQLTAYGTIYPVEKKENLNKMRETASLPALSMTDINKIPEPEDIPEIDGKDAEYTVWRKKVGWI